MGDIFGGKGEEKEKEKERVERREEGGEKSGGCWLDYNLQPTTIHHQTPVRYCGPSKHEKFRGD